MGGENVNKELEAFENRSDDWLAKERKREELISAWDLDEGHKLKEEHRENCEAYEIKKNHEIKHSRYNELNKISLNANNQFHDLEPQKIVKVFVPVFVSMLLIIFIGIFIASGIINVGEMGLAIPIIIIILLANLLPSKRRK